MHLGGVFCDLHVEDFFKIYFQNAFLQKLNINSRLKL